MKFIYACLTSIVLLANSLGAHAQSGDLNLNGMATFEQLRKEYYIGALYLGWPGHDQAAIANMPGKKRMELHITADRWPSLRFAQMWNQAITINNASAFINANALDILAFTSLPKGDLVEGDRMVIELLGNNTTQVSVNGLVALRTNSPALFTMLINAWIGARPPSSEFKRDILDLPKDQAGTELATRYDSIRPNDARKKAIAGWGFKVEPEAAAPAVAAVTATATAAASAATPTAKKPEPEPAKPEPAAKPAAEPKPLAEAKPEPKPEPKAAATPTPVTTPTPEAAKPAPVVAAPKPMPTPQPETTVAVADKAAHDNEQDSLNQNYYGIVRKQVIRNIDYPRRAIKENIEGLVMVRIKVDHSGSLSSFEIAQSADDVLDAEAERAVKKAAPFPKAPDGLEGNSFEYIVPIVFKLSQ